MLSYSERKHRLPNGAISRVAEGCGVAQSTVSHVLKGVHRNRTVEVALARLMTPKTSATAAFGPGFKMLRKMREIRAARSAA